MNGASYSTAFTVTVTTIAPLDDGAARRAQRVASDKPAIHELALLLAFAHACFAGALTNKKHLAASSALQYALGPLFRSFLVTGGAW